jgi:hypothetical protein
VSISSPAATRAKKIQQREQPEPSVRSQVSVPSLSPSLNRFALALCFAKIRRALGRMPHGHGFDFEIVCTILDTLCCPSDFGRVVLGLTISGIGCSCSPSVPTPVASDWQGWHKNLVNGRTKSGFGINLRDYVGGVPHPEYVEELMGFPIGWSDLGGSEMP